MKNIDFFPRSTTQKFQCRHLEREQWNLFTLEFFGSGYGNKIEQKSLRYLWKSGWGDELWNLKWGNKRHEEENKERCEWIYSKERVNAWENLMRWKRHSWSKRMKQKGNWLQSEMRTVVSALVVYWNHLEIFKSGQKSGSQAGSMKLESQGGA